MKPYIKDPDAVLDYEFDWGRWLEGDTIDTHQVFPSPGITVASSNNSDSVVTVWLSGGVEGQQYSVTCRITTALGRVDDRTIPILVRSR